MQKYISLDARKNIKTSKNIQVTRAQEVVAEINETTDQRMI